jgi:DNA-binding transcriptional ArsR family regulator
MDKSPLEKIFGNSAQTTVLESLLKNQGEFIHLSGIARETGLSHSSVARVLEPLIENNIVIEKRLGKQIRTFTLNKENEIVKMIIKFYCDLVALYGEK